MSFCPQCANRVQPREVHGVNRMACSSPHCDFVLWENPVPVVAALVQVEHHFVLARNARWSHGLFSLVSDYLEKHEAPELAVLREVKEELGLDGEVEQFIGHYPLLAKNQLIIAYRIRASGNITLNDELAEYKLVNQETLRQYDFGPFGLTKQIVTDCDFDA